VPLFDTCVGQTDMSTLDELPDDALLAMMNELSPSRHQAAVPALSPARSLSPVPVPTPSDSSQASSVVVEDAVWTTGLGADDRPLYYLVRRGDASVIQESITNKMPLDFARDLKGKIAGRRRLTVDAGLDDQLDAYILRSHLEELNRHCNGLPLDHLRAAHKVSLLSAELRRCEQDLTVAVPAPPLLQKRFEDTAMELDDAKERAVELKSMHDRYMRRHANLEAALATSEAAAAQKRSHKAAERASAPALPAGATERGSRVPFNTVWTPPERSASQPNGGEQESELATQALLNQRVQVWWAGDRCWYTALVTRVSEVKQRRAEGWDTRVRLKFHLKYADGEAKDHYLNEKEVWRRA
jgi:hypothetical protein